MLTKYECFVSFNVVLKLKESTRSMTFAEVLVFSIQLYIKCE